MGASACIPGAGTISIAAVTAYTKGAPVATCDADVSLLTPDTLAISTDAAVVNRLYKISATLCEFSTASLVLLGTVWDEAAIDGVAGPDNIGITTDTTPSTYAIIATMGTGGVAVTLTAGVAGSSEVTSEPGSLVTLSCEYTGISAAGGSLGSIA